MFTIFLSAPETKLFATFAGKFSHIPSSSAFSIDNTIFRKADEADPYNSSSGIRYEYSRHTAFASLRPHIEKYHLELYLTLAKENGWTISLPGLIAQTRLATNDATTAQGEQPDL